jgi:hypothetical protein
MKSSASFWKAVSDEGEPRSTGAADAVEKRASNNPRRRAAKALFIESDNAPVLATPDG